MSFYEYRAVPAPRKGSNAKGVKGGPAKFANAVTELMNAMSADGWDYLRADTLPCEERQGLTGKTVKYHSMLVFRRALVQEAGVTETPLALPVPTEEPAEEVWHAPEHQATEYAEETPEDALQEPPTYEEPAEEYAEEYEQTEQPDRTA